MPCSPNETANQRKANQRPGKTSGPEMSDTTRSISDKAMMTRELSLDSIDNQVCLLRHYLDLDRHNTMLP